jgi:hypothetical protein
MYSLLGTIMTGRRDPFPMTEHMQWGIDHEDEARIWYEGISGNTVREVGFCLREDIDRVGCSPDGLIDPDGLIEIKCPMSKTHVKYTLEGPPKDYINQMQYQMMVTGRDWCDFVTFDPRMPDEAKGHIVRVPRDEEHIAKLLNCVKLMQKDMREYLEARNLLHLWEKT